MLSEELSEAAFAHASLTTRAERPVAVSVVMPFHNEGRFLEEAIASVLAQTFTRWELLLVDDGSSDASTSIARQYADRYPDRVRYLEHPGHGNRGTSASRNLGIRSARGDYIAFLDGDDVWLPHKLERQIDLLEANPKAAMVYGPSERWFSWSDNPAHPDDLLDVPRPSGGALMSGHALVAGTVTRQIHSPLTSSMIARREAVEMAGGFEESFPGMYDDQVFTSKIALKGPVLVDSDCSTRYRQHPGSCYSTAKANGSWRAARLAYLAWMKKYLAEQGLRRGDVWAAADAEYRSLARSLPPGSYVERFRRIARRPVRYLLLPVVRAIVPRVFRPKLRAVLRRHADVPPPGSVRLGNLRRVTPISRKFGMDRGLPIDRFYIEQFLASHSTDIRGHVLEVGDNVYTRRFGGERVAVSDVLHVSADNERATIVADLTRANNVASCTFDCIVLTQTLQFIFDSRAAVRTLHRILKPGGVVLATVGGISQISRWDMERWGHYWNFTSLSMQRLFGEQFPSAAIDVRTYGNVLSAIGFLEGLAASEIESSELNERDQDYEVVIAVRAVKQQ